MKARSMEAIVLCCGYELGLFDKSDIEKWADRQIIASDNPSIELLDLSMLRNTHPLDVINRLRAQGSSDPTTIIQTKIGILGLLRKRKAITTELTIRKLFAFALEPGVTQEQESMIYYLDDGYDLAKCGVHGKTAEIEKELDDFLADFANILVEKHPHLFELTN